MAATLKSRLPAIAAELRPRVSAAVKESAEAIANEARTRAPVGTGLDPHPGRLRDSIHVERTGGAEYAVVVDARADKKGVSEAGAPYGNFVEFGTEKMGAQPFLIPAAELGTAAAAARVTAVLRTL